MLLFVLWVLVARGARFSPREALRQRCFHTDDPTCDRLVYNVHVSTTGKYQAMLHDLRHAIVAGSDEQSACAVSVNGEPGLFTPVDNVTLLSLSTGNNVVAVSCSSELVAELTVVGALERPLYGALLPYDELEAERANYSGVLIGPDFTYTHLPSEASQRKAVQLRIPGQYIEFTLLAPASAAMLRFSIPDAPAGGGMQTPVLLFIDNEPMGQIMLTSRYSWQYGGYPYNKNPADGFPHHFYDEVSFWLRPGGSNETSPAGTRVRLQLPSPTRESRATVHGHLTQPSQSPAPVLPASPEPSPVAPLGSCNISLWDKRDCGYNGINQTLCLARGCCWFAIIPNPDTRPYCYFQALPGPTPSQSPTPSASPLPPPPPGVLVVTIDLVDFFDVPPPASAPPGSVSVLSQGADPSGRTDSTSAFVSTIAAAQAMGTAVWVPPGNYTITQHVVLPSNTSIIGAGPWYSLLHGDGVGLYGNGAPTYQSINVFVRGLSIAGEVLVRNDSAISSGIGGSFSDSTISNVYISHQKCGIWVDGPASALLISGVIIRDTTADGVNLHRGLTNSAVEHSSIRNTGDDGLAMWSDSVANVANGFRQNTVQIPVLANAIAVYGGANNSVVSNYVADTITEGGGLHLGNRFGSVAASGIFTISSNQAVRTGCVAPDFPQDIAALWFFAQDENIAASINATGNLLQDSPYAAVLFLGSSVESVVFDETTVMGAGSFVFQFQCGGVAASNVVATDVGYAGIYNCSAPLDFYIGPGNSGWNSWKCGMPPKYPLMRRTVV